ncbi:MAG: PH domain-containing protein [Planctomycetota bacterium]
MRKYKFDCPHCGKRFKADESYPGQTVACPSCEGGIIIPDSPKSTAKPAKIVTESSEEFAEKSDSEPALTLRPVFIPRIILPMVISVQLLFTIGGVTFCGILGSGVVKALELPLPSWFTYVFFGCLFFFGTPLPFYMIAKKMYAHTEYQFFRDRLEYTEGVRTAENKTLKYDDITEITMRRGGTQKRYGLGTIELATPAKSSEDDVEIRDIEEPEKVFETIQEILVQ